MNLPNLDFRDTAEVPSIIWLLRQRTRPLLPLTAILKVITRKFSPNSDYIGYISFLPTLYSW